MEHRRQTRGSTGLDVSRAAYDHAGHWQCTHQAAEHVAHPLGRQFLVEIGTLTTVHTVHRCGRQQGFGTGNKRHGECRDQKLWICQVQQVAGAQPVDSVRQVFRDFHALDLQRQHQAGNSRQAHAKQRARHKPQLLRAEFVPQVHHQHRRQTKYASLPAEPAAEGRNCFSQRCREACQVIQP